MSERRARQDLRAAMYSLARVLRGLIQSQLELRRAIEASMQAREVPVVFPGEEACERMAREIAEVIGE